MKLMDRPIRAMITKKQDEEIYTLHISRYGDRLRECSIQLTDEQVHRLRWWR